MADSAENSIKRDVKVIALVSAAHGMSHFYQLVPGPLFLLIKESMGVSYTELSFIVMAFFSASGLAQAPAGFLVDRYGGRRVLIGGLVLEAIGLGLMGLSPRFWLLLPLALLAGLGNSVFHPAGYSILSHLVNSRRVARAYSAHTFFGNIGWAMAPAVTLGLAGLFGWRGALLCIGLAGIGIALLFAAGSRHLIDDLHHRQSMQASGHTLTNAAYLAVLLSPRILFCFGYFVLLAITLTCMQNFMPSALHLIYGIAPQIAAWALTVYLIGGALGILAGGVAADRFPHHEWIVCAGFLTAATLLLTVAVTSLPIGMLMTTIALAGFASGTTTPSRDMLVRHATPPGSIGKVFGFVYSGVDLGNVFAPPMMGYFLDHGLPRMVFVTAAASLICAIAAAFGTRWNVAGRQAAPRPTPAE